MTMPETPRRSALLVEDDSGFSEILRHFLGQWRIDVVTTGSSLTANLLLEHRSFDLYLVDLRLADTDAEALLTRLEADGRASHCVVVTAFPRVATAFTRFPVVDKSRLASLGTHLLRILGSPQPAFADGIVS